MTIMPDNPAAKGFDPIIARERASCIAGAATRETNSSEAHMALDVIDLLAVVDELRAGNDVLAKTTDVARRLLDAANEVIENLKARLAELRAENAALKPVRSIHEAAV